MMASSDTPKLYYFDTQGRVEIIMLILAYTGTEFEDVRFSQEEWGSKYKGESPLGMAPYYEEGGVKLGGSLAIARYVGEKYGVGGSNPMENAQLASYADALYDIGIKLQGAKLGPEHKREEIKADFLKNIPARFQCIEKHIKGGDSFLEGKVSWVDIMLFTVCSFIVWAECEQVMNGCPKIKAILDKFNKNEKIQAFHAKHPPIPKV